MPTEPATEPQQSPLERARHSLAAPAETLAQAEPRRGQLPRGSTSRALPAAAIAGGVALAMAAYGYATSRDLVAAMGLCAIGVIGLAVTLAAFSRARRLERRCQMLGRARAESERARHVLEVENAELERRNAELEAQHAAIVDGFEWVDEQTAGRLRDLLEAAGTELADLAEAVLDDDREDG
jgi:hypothetical protein